MNEFVEVFRAVDRVAAESFVQILHSHGIEANVTAGDSEPVECRGSKTFGILIEPSKADVAKRLLLEAQKELKAKNKEMLDPRGWACPRCETEIESGIYVCWKCQYNPAAC